MGTKRIVGLGVGLVLVANAIFFLKPKTGSGEPLRISTWSNYYPESLLQQFEKDTGLKLEVSYISSNEELLAKFKAGQTGYDVIQPSDYMVRQMSRLGMLAALDHSQLSNLTHVDPFYKNLPYDPGLKFSAPFTWGSTGIAVNTKAVKIPEGGVTWSLLFESPDFRHTSVLDDMREIFAAALIWKGFPLNTTEMKTLELARDTIQAVKPKILMFTSETRAALLKGEVNIAHAFSVDGTHAGMENTDIKYFIPKEGGTLWTDNFAVPATSSRNTDAHKFINYFLDPDVAVKICIENQLATVNKTARGRLPVEQLQNPGLYPDAETMKKLQLMDDLGETLNQMNRLWNELKSS